MLPSGLQGATMQRRLARERKEYLMRRSAEGKANEIHERKKELRRYLEEGRRRP